MRRLLRFLLNKFFALILVTLPMSALAQTSIVFERTDIRIEPVIMQSSQANEPVEVRAASAYSIEVRGQDALRFDSIQSLNTLGDSSGVMIVFNAPSTAPLPAYRDDVALDVAFVAEDGTILKTVADINPANMKESIGSLEPAKAFLFLKGGQLAQHSIRARDVVTGSMFIRDAAR